MTEVSLPDSLRTMGEYAFSNCNGLENVYFSPSVKNIDRKAFENCVSLENVTLGNGTKSVPSALVAGHYGNMSLYSKH